VVKNFDSTVGTPIKALWNSQSTR